MTNPLLAPWTAPFGLPPFDAIRDEDFAPALDQGLAEARAAIAAIAEDPAAPTFANTIEALEMCEETLSRLAAVFYSVASADSTAAREALQRDLAPKLAAYSSEITNNRPLFQRIDTLWQDRDRLALTAEQERVLMLYRRRFVRAGAELEGDRAARMTEVQARLAVLGTQFTQNLLADERAWFMELAPED
ncbi:MAG: peptidase M3, partial [Rhodobacter sp.]|nr:peptidase M3 [Rhodobacter sp.]